MQTSMSSFRHAQNCPKLHLFSKHHHIHIQRNNEKHPNDSKPANQKQDQTRIQTPNLNHRLPLGTTVLKFQNVCCDLISPWQFHHPPRLDAWQKRRRHKLLAQLGVDKTLGLLLFGKKNIMKPMVNVISGPLFLKHAFKKSNSKNFRKRRS